MKLKIYKTYLKLLPLLVVIFFKPQSSFAEQENFNLTSDTHKVLTNINIDMENNDFFSAKNALTKWLKTNKLNKYDKAVSYQTMGYIENGLGNYLNAIEAFKKALHTNVLPKEIYLNILYITAQLLIYIERPYEGLKYLNNWFNNTQKAKAEDYTLAASAYYQLKNYQQVIVQIETALSLSYNPPLNWYELLLSAYYETKKYKKGILVLEKIISKRPNKKDYWLQLIALLQEVKQDKKSLVVYELAYNKGLLEEQDIIQLIKLYLHLGIPYKAAIVLDKELKNGAVSKTKETSKLLVDCWLLAKETEKAEHILKELINNYNEDNARLKLAQIYIDKKKWQEISQLLDVKLKSNDQKLKSKINLLLGIAQYKIQKPNKAILSFNKALSNKSTSKQASSWLQHIKNQ